MSRRVIRCGERKNSFGISSQDTQTLLNYWAWEEEVGLRKKPEDNILEKIPPVKLKFKDQQEVDNESTGSV